MGRTKARPTRRPEGTIVGAAAIAASPSLPELCSALSRLNNRATRNVPTTMAAAGTAASPPPSSPRKRSKKRVAFVTPPKSAKGSLKRKLVDANAKEDEDDNVVFDKPASGSAAASRKIIFDDEDTDFGAASASASASTCEIRVEGKRRRISDEDSEEKNVLNSSKEVKTFTIDIGTGEVTLINIPPSAYKIVSPIPHAYELVRFHLVNTKVAPIASNEHMIVLENNEAVEITLKHCTQSLISGSQSLLDVASILSAYEGGMLDVALTIVPDQSKVEVSIRLLLASCLDRLQIACIGNGTPPIPIPRKLPGRNNTGFTQPHPTYTLLKALGGIFTGSIFEAAKALVNQKIFEDVAKSFVNQKEKKKGTDSLITAKMVYSVIDNTHAKEFEEPSALPPLDIPSLVPTLRPYQQAAVRWMLKREGKYDGSTGDASNNDEWELCWFVIVEHPRAATSCEKDINSLDCSYILPLPEWKLGKSSHDERHIFVNPFAGWLAPTHEEAKHLMLGRSDCNLVKGGILAESMGLGKTVEVIACILANPSPLSLQATNPPTQMQAEIVQVNSNVGAGIQSDSSEIISLATNGRDQNIAYNSMPKPSTIHDAVCICSRSKSYKDCLSWVVCEDCKVAMHGRCAGFGSEKELVSKTKEDPGGGARICTQDHCPTCVTSTIAQDPTNSIIESRATLIVTPAAILSQWQKEINRHTKISTTGKPLKVVTYPGVKDLCNAGFSSPHDDFHLVHARNLADADIVLVTFQTLMSDLGHSDDNPFAGSAKGRSCLRSRKRYVVLPSPLTHLKWWRVCLDEAQRVEAPTAASAKMARKLVTDKRWCVSGTPIGRGRLDDLHGLLLFLSIKPFDEKRWFSASFDISHGDAMKRLSHLLQNIMWRSTKSNKSVCQQMGIPEQEEVKVALHFSSVEKYFYRKQLEETSRDVHCWTESKGHNLLSATLQKLRAACCHPQVGASGVGGRHRRQQGTNNVLTMDQILEKLIEESKIKCEEAQRTFTLHTIGLAGLTKLKADVTNDTYAALLEKSMSIYQEALDMADANASPTEVIGTTVLSGSVGFQLDQKTINDGAARLSWKVMPNLERDVEEIVPSVWCCFTFAGPPKKISSIRVQACHNSPPDVQKEVTILRPKECILQASSVAAGNGFVDVHAFTVLDNTVAQEIAGFHARKAKAWRLVIRSYHNDFEQNSEMEHDQYYTSIDVQLFEPEIADDSLQKLHILHNASLVLSTLAQLDDASADAKLERMKKEEQEIYDNYMALAQAVHSQSKKILSSAAKAREKCDADLNKLSEGSDRPWYEDALAWFALSGDREDQQNLCDAVKHNLHNFSENYSNSNSLGGATKKVGQSGLSHLDHTLIRTGKFPPFDTVDGLFMSLNMRIQQGEDEVGLRQGISQEECVRTVMNLSSTPSDGEVFANSRCRRCREDWNQTGPVCAHCHLGDDLVKFQRLSNDPEISCVLKAISKAVQDCNSKSGNENKQYLLQLNRRSSKFFTLQTKTKEEIGAAINLAWKAHFDLLSDIDELNQCKRAMRLRMEAEDISALAENEAAFIVEPSNIAVGMYKHEAEQAAALAKMKEVKDSLRYLKNQRLERISKNNGSEICTICYETFDGERSVLPCGHSFHSKCVDRIFKRSGGATIRCTMRCQITIRREDILIASDKSKKDGSTAPREIKGDWGTKVNRLVGDVIDAIRLGDKGVIFSQWEEMLDIVVEALLANQIKFVRPRSGKRFGEDIRQFCSRECPILLMNVKNGAEGLTLTEANHVFMLEPMLNSGLDLQAISRIHRIGQTAKTYVHRYIVANTIEEKIDAIRMERQENHFEDDLLEQQKHSIKGGGIDGGFDLSELHRLFG